MKKLLILCSFVCVFLELVLAKPIIVSAKSDESVIKEDIMYIYGAVLNDVLIKEKGNKIIVELDAKSTIRQTDFNAMSNDIKSKISVILQKDCVVKYSVVNKLIFED